jgi:hypothetical protein
MRNFIFHYLLRLLGRPYYKPLSEEECDFLLTRLATEDGFDRFPDFLQQCADAYRNQYLYSGNEMFKGTVLAFTTLREQVLEKRNPKKKKSLTGNDESGTMSSAKY